MKLPEKSLLRRMILGQVLVVLAFCALAIGNLLWQFYRPVGGEGDASLRLQSAVLSASLVPTTDAGAVPGGLTPGHFAVLEAVALSLEALDDPHGSPSKPGLNRRVWVLDANGATLYQTPGADALAMPNQRAGFFDLAATDGSGPWRAYAHTSSHGVTVQIARRAVPNDNVSQIIGVYVLLPLLGFLPLMGVAAGLSSRQMLRPLGQFARLIAQRSPNDLAPVQQVSDYAEIRPLVGEINGLLAKLAHTLSRERAFLADAAHELRTPLAVIQTQAHVLRHATDEAGKNLAAKELQAGMERAASLIGQLLLTARLDDGSFQPNLAPLELVALLQDRVAVFSGFASKIYSFFNQILIKLVFK